MFRLAGQRLLSSSTSTASATTIIRSRAKQSASSSMTTVNQLWTATTGNSLLPITCHHRHQRQQPQAAGIRCFAEVVSTTSPDQSEWQKKRAIHEANWNSKYALLQQYKKDKADCLVPTSYTVNGVALGLWISCQRHEYRLLQEGKPSAMTRERIDKLEALGLDWDPFTTQWNSTYELLRQYYNDKGDSLIPQSYTVDGVALYRWAVNQRTEYRKLQEGKPSHMTEERINKLAAVGFDWSPSKTQWNLRYELLQQYKKDKGDCRVPRSYTVKGVALGVWVNTQRQEYWQFQKGKHSHMTEERINKLDAIDFDWSPGESKWNLRYELLQKYKNDKADCLVPTSYTVNGVALGNWINTQRQEYRKLQEGKPSGMTEERINKLETLGIDWSPHKMVRLLEK